MAINIEFYFIFYLSKTWKVYGQIFSTAIKNSVLKGSDNKWLRLRYERVRLRWRDEQTTGRNNIMLRRGEQGFVSRPRVFVQRIAPAKGRSGRDAEGTRR